MSLADSAIRLRRTNWQNRENLLAEELYLILLQDRDIQSGPITIHLGDGDDGIELPPDVIRDPLGGWEPPDFHLPDFRSNQGGPVVSDTEAGDNQIIRTQVRTQHQRIMLPGLIVSGSGAVHVVNLAPNSSLGGFITVAGVVELNGATLSANTWVSVYRYLEVELKTTQWIEKITGVSDVTQSASGSVNVQHAAMGERVIRTETSLDVKSTRHEIPGGGGGSGGGIPCKIISGGPGAVYEAELYLSGPTNDPTEASVTQLSIADDETIPEGTWTLATKIGNVYYVQVPVWL